MNPFELSFHIFLVVLGAVLLCIPRLSRDQRLVWLLILTMNAVIVAGWAFDFLPNKISP